MTKALTIVFLSFILINCGKKEKSNGLLPQNMGAEHYTASSVSISPDDQPLFGPDEISTHWGFFFENTSLPGRTVLASVPVGNNNEHSYEISRFETANGQAFAQVIIWDKEEKDSLRALEFIAAYKEPHSDASEINAARTLWMEYCNAHAVDQLIEKMYAPNTLYYNHRPLLLGRKALKQEYTYMANPDYQLTLSPLHVVPVSGTIALELGQCSGSYGGKYLIVWQKQRSGNWQVLLDANL